MILELAIAFIGITGLLWMMGVIRPRTYTEVRDINPKRKPGSFWVHDSSWHYVDELGSERVVEGRLR